MARKLVNFFKGWGRYNKGETAAFDPKKALSLTEGKNRVGVIVGDAEELTTSHLSTGLSGAPVPAAMLQAGMEMEVTAQRLQEQEKELRLKQLELAQKEQDLADREAALAAAPASESATEEAKDPGKEEAETMDSTPGDGSPPKQGAKK